MRKFFVPGTAPTSINSDHWKFANLNSDNFRAPELDTIDWNNSIVAFGCSTCFGTGLKDEEVFTYQLQEMIGIPVINMGVPATSIKFALLNQLTLHELGYKPKAVINMWSSASRQTMFVGDIQDTTQKRFVNLGSWLSAWPQAGEKEKLRQTYELWNRYKANTKYHAQINQRCAEALWRDTIHLQYTTFNENELDNVTTLEEIDTSPLGHHSGPESHRAWAEIISTDYGSRV